MLFVVCETVTHLRRCFETVLVSHELKVIVMRSSMVIYWRLDARKLLGGVKNDPTTRETSPEGGGVHSPEHPTHVLARAQQHQ